MDTVIRIAGVHVKNMKNVKNGMVKTNSSFDSLNRADVIGLYGQNGSGKTAFVEAFALLKALLSNEELPLNSQYLLTHGQEKLELCFEFIIKNTSGEYFVDYEAAVAAGKERMMVSYERLSYRENLPSKRFKEIILKSDSKLRIRNKDVRDIAEDLRVNILVANKYATENSKTFVFNPEISGAFEQLLNPVELELMHGLKQKFAPCFHVIDAETNGYIFSKFGIPFSIHLTNIRGQLPYDFKDISVVPPIYFDVIQRVAEQINVVLTTIVPGLQIVVRKINVEKMTNGEDGIRYECLSRKEGVELPLRCESAGILKIISILSTLIAVYNNPTACVVLDELDTAIFEYLLGELLEVISENGKGQLFFTSHNLRILEVLNYKSLWFTTMNENNRFIQLKGVKTLSNVRDMYLRAVQLGGQSEELYRETNAFDIKKAFRKAGVQNA